MPVDYQHINGKGGMVAVWKIEESEDQLTAMLPVNFETKLQLRKFSCKSRRLEWLASRVLLYQITQCIPFVEYNQLGQPFVREINQVISISHTLGYAAVCISSEESAGVDIEYPSERISRLSSRFVNTNEVSFISEVDKSIFHALIWCAKETIYKIAGLPGTNFKRDIEILPFIPKKEGVFFSKLYLNNEERVYQLLYKAETDYYLVWHY